jgi:hypothetical protein
VPRLRASALRTPAELGAHLAKWTAWIDGLAKTGHSDSHPPPLENGGKTVRGSSKTVTDGPYAEAKALVSGILMISADSLEVAVELARGCPIYEYNGSVEVRTFMAIPQPASAAR